MPDYNNGRIYTVRCRTDNSLINVGSTTMPLSKRFQLHKTNKSCALYKHIQEKCNGDWSDWYIELYEEYPCDNKEQLNKREGEIQRELGTINKNKAGRTLKEYYTDNKDIILEYQKQYRSNNKNTILEYQNKYRSNNKDIILEYKKQYYSNNKDKYKQHYIKNRQQLLDYQKDNYKFNKNKKIIYYFIILILLYQCFCQF